MNSKLKKSFLIPTYKQKVTIYISDSFKNTPFKGNHDDSVLALTDTFNGVITCAFLKKSFDINTIVHESVHIKNILVDHFNDGVIDNESEAYLLAHISEKIYDIGKFL